MLYGKSKKSTLIYATIFLVSTLLFTFSYIAFKEQIILLRLKKLKLRLKNITQLTQTGDCKEAHLSPDGNFIVFSRGKEISSSLWLMKTSESSMKQITKGFYDVSPFYSPDGRQIIFARLIPEEKGFYAWLIEVKNSSSRPLNIYLGAAGTGSFAWNPDGKKVALCRGSDIEGKIYLLDLKSKNLKPLYIPNAQLASMPSWSPNGKKIVYQLLITHPLPDGSSNPYGHCHLWVTDLSEDKFYQLTYGSEDEIQEAPSWSPDGKWIAYIYQNLEKEEKAKICLISSDGRTQVELTNWGDYEGPISWFPNGKEILFLKSGDIWKATIDF